MDKYKETPVDETVFANLTQEEIDTRIAAVEAHLGLSEVRTIPIPTGTEEPDVDPIQLALNILRDLDESEPIFREYENQRLI